MSMDFGSFGRFGRIHGSVSLHMNANVATIEADLSSPTLFRRCAQCPSQPPPCPSCASDQICTLTGGGCETCAVSKCTNLGATPSTTSTPSGAPAGPIAGGVIGGILFICLVTFLVWRFYVRAKLAERRRQQQYDDWPDTATNDEKDVDGFSVQRDRRNSTHSVRSIASTVLTRASNVIQIAYIPGVTNRSEHSTPDLIPPVPPIPAFSPAHSQASTPAATTTDQHFFMPSDLRDSTYSDYTVDRNSYARTSVATSRVPSTAYRGSAVVNTMPAQTAIRGRANPVAVKSNGKNSPIDTPRAQTPPVPVVNRSRPDARNENIQTNTTSPIVARLGVPKAVTVTKAPSHGNLLAAAGKGAGPLRIEKFTQKPYNPNPEQQASVAGSRHDGASSTFEDVSSDEESPADRSLMGHEKLPQFAKSPPSNRSAPEFHKPSAMSQSSSSPDQESSPRHFTPRERKQKHKRSGSLNQIIEEAARRASREPRHGGLGSVGSIAGNWKRELRGEREGPFSDANAARTP